ncbi:MAG: glycosyltransferase [Solirubrobacterales bacterium]|nr:glycosyltransferase [Solirubrobacterales bacterium]
MSTAPSLTVVTPTYNADATIRETLSSIQSQGYPALEHIVVDGGSTDGTVELLAEEAEAGRLRYISEPDRGLSDAFNKGVAMATGDWIAWLNADDTYEPGALAVVGAALAGENGAEWAVGRCKIMGGSGEESRKAVTAYKNFLLKRFSLRLYLTNNFVSSPATFVRRTVLDEIGALDERFKYSADYDLWLRLARRSNPVYIDADVARFRMADDSLSITGFEEQFVEHAQNAVDNGEGHRVAVAINQLMSRAIVLVYRSIMRWRRSRGA